nr:hypothetical protein [Streptomyces dangxiongensis]
MVGEGERVGAVVAAEQLAYLVGGVAGGAAGERQAVLAVQEFR